MNTRISADPATPPQARPRHHLPLVLMQLAFVAALFGLVLFFRQSPEFATLSITFVSIFLEALPFMLLGALIGGVVDVFVSQSLITRLVPARSLPAVVLAAGLGMLFPVCECAIVPVVRRLFNKGLPLGAGIAFLLGAPIVNPLVALSTAVAYGNDWAMAGQRMVYGYLIAVAVGLLVERFFSRQTALVDQPPGKSEMAHGACEDHSASIRYPKRILLALHHGASDFIDISRYLVVGAFVAGVLQTLVARGDLATLFDSTLLSVLAMMILALTLSLCSEADAFVAASFRTTLPVAAQMAFMVLGPMLDLKLIAMYVKMFKIRLILFLSLTTFIIVFLSLMVGTWIKA